MLAPALPAAADEPLPDLAVRAKDAVFAALDANRDGYVSRREAARHAGVARAFDTADQDRDGRLSPLEFSRIAVNRNDQPGPYKTSTRA
jgi:Ca2+-binding EF-hand superfamily protein